MKLLIKIAIACIFVFILCIEDFEANGKTCDQVSPKGVENVDAVLSSLKEVQKNISMTAKRS